MIEGKRKEERRKGKDGRERIEGEEMFGIALSISISISLFLSSFSFHPLKKNQCKESVISENMIKNRIRE